MGLELEAEVSRLNYYKSQQETERFIDLDRIFEVIASRKRLIAFLWLLFFIIISLGILQAGQNFSSKSLLKIDEERVQSLGSLDRFREIVSSKSVGLVSDIETIKSSRLVGSVVRELKLDVKVENVSFPVFGSVMKFPNKLFGDEIPQWLNGYAWLDDELTINSLLVSENLENQEFNISITDTNTFSVEVDLDDVTFSGKGSLGEINHFSIDDTSFITIDIDAKSKHGKPSFTVKKLSYEVGVLSAQGKLAVAETVPGSGVVAIEYTSKDLEQSAQVVNLLADFYIQNITQENSEDIKRSIDFLNDKITPINERVNDASKKLSTFQKKNKSVNLDTEARGLLLRKSELQSSVTLLQQDLSTQRTLFTENHPKVKEINKKIGIFRSEIRSIDRKLSKFPNVEQEIASLSQELENSQKMRNDLLRSLQELKLAQEGVKENASVIDYAMAVGEPSSRNTKILMFLGAVVALFISCIIAFFQKKVSRNVESNSEIMKNMGVEVLGKPISLERISPLDTNNMRFDNLLTHDKSNQGGSGKNTKAPTNELIFSNSLENENIRKLRTTVFNLKESKGSGIVAITSPKMIDNDERFIMAFTNSIAKTGKKVVLLDVNFYNDAVNRELNINDARGISNFLHNEINKDDLLTPVKENYYFIPRGDSSLFSPDIICRSEFSNLIQELEEEFDFVILHSPPVLSSSESSIICRMAGIVLMSVKYKATKLNEVEYSSKELKKDGIDIDGVVAFT